jgi:glutamate carboxypeptidase
VNPEPGDPLAAALAAWVGRQRRRAESLLGELVALETPSGDAPALDRAAARIADLLAQAGAVVTLIPGPGGSHVRARLDGAAPGGSTLVLAHLDTVWPVGETVRRPFVAAAGVARGPGAYDMKGGLVALILAAEALRALDLEPPRPVVAAIVADEERGSPDGRRLLMAEAMNVTWALGLEAPLADGRLKVGRRGVARVGIEVTGSPAHAGLDRSAGVSAIDELVDRLGHVRLAASARRGLDVNVGRIAGGTAANVVAGVAEAMLDLRFDALESLDSFVADIANAPPSRAGASVRITVQSLRPPWRARDDWSFDHVRGAATRIGRSIGAGIAGGAGDANLVGSWGVPTVDGLGPEGGGAHALGEHVALDSIVERAVLLALLFVEPPDRPPASANVPGDSLPA